jgi:hypothetical protein
VRDEDMDDGIEVKFHDSFSLGINVPCQEIFDRECEHFGNEDLRTRSLYAWSVWDVEAKEVKILMAAVNNCSPIPAIVSMYEAYGTLIDRDYVITKTGKQKDATYGVVPMDKAKFRNDKAKAFSKAQFLKMLDKAYPDDGSGDDEEDEKPAKSKGKAKPAAKPAKDEDDGGEYDDMTPKQLYDLCVESGIEVEKKQPKEYYIEQLEAAKEEEDEWPEDEDEEAAPDYSSMTAKELYTLCKERGIDAAPKKPEKFYIKLLEEYDAQQEDWGDEEGGDDWDE